MYQKSTIGSHEYLGFVHFKKEPLENSCRNKSQLDAIILLPTLIIVAKFAMCIVIIFPGYALLFKL